MALFKVAPRALSTPCGRSRLGADPGGEALAPIDLNRLDAKAEAAAQQVDKEEGHSKEEEGKPVAEAEAAAGQPAQQHAPQPAAMHPTVELPEDSDDEVVVVRRPRGKTPALLRRAAPKAAAATPAAADAVPPAGRSLLASTPVSAPVPTATTSETPMEESAELRAQLRATEVGSASREQAAVVLPEVGASVKTKVEHFEKLQSTPPAGEGSDADAVPPAGGSTLAFTPLAAQGGKPVGHMADAVPPAGGSKLALTPVGGANMLDAVPPAGGSKLALTPVGGANMLDAVPPAGGSKLALTPVGGADMADAVPPAGGNKLALTPQVLATAPATILAAVPSPAAASPEAEVAASSPPVPVKYDTPPAVAAADADAVPPAGGSRLMMTPMGAAPMPQVQASGASARSPAKEGVSSPVEGLVDPLAPAPREASASADSEASSIEFAVVRDGSKGGDEDVEMMDVDSPVVGLVAEGAGEATAAAVASQQEDDGVAAQLDLSTAEAHSSMQQEKEQRMAAGASAASARAAASAAGNADGTPTATTHASDNFEAYLDRIMAAEQAGGNPFAAGGTAMANSPAIKPSLNPYTPVAGRMRREHDPYACTKRA